MFQSFEVTSTPQFGKERTTALRAALATLGVDGFLVPRADEFQGEYVPRSSERLSWLTGFTGSAGVALVTQREAIVFVDGRYVTQLKEQVDGSVFTGGDLIGEPPHVWLERHGPKGFRLGIDPWLHTAAEVRRLEKALAAIGGSVVLLDHNPLDRLWTDRPATPLGPVTIQPVEHAGQLAKDKIAEIAAGVAKAKAAAVVLTDPSSVAWTFNIRGSDVPHTPHPLARAIIHADGSAELFLDKRKTGIEQEAYLTQLADIMAPASFDDRLAALASTGAAIMIDPDLAPFAIGELIRRKEGSVVEAVDPARLPRACKNAAEIAGSTRAHLQDGAAMVEFLAWLDGREPGSVTEIGATRQLEATRAAVGERMQNPLKDVSFDTIAGAGSHAAIMHYRVTNETDRRIEAGTMFLIDSGAQYINGTTDITRTVAIGAVPEEQKRFFTLVLKGMIAISTARFPKGSRGVDLDPLARIALWKAGADYAHGTGHGVGSYLSVHEGPQRIARLATQELLPGMILSNEPGYYRPGAFGIRIENLVVVREPEEIEGGDQPMLGFDTLTFCPIDRRLVLPALLTDDELDWLNAYHAETLEKLMPLLSGTETRDYLASATEAIVR
ncbi:aminopeptidase P family protein [Sinorhizobium meliloti]|uniref:aminopeptidase P family protein n=3 Tax=Rhizobium meliloti TaxID=382 RepID=UPI000FD9568F|nr:aminopeptidase P family protein [Sinorhizobium meliloti]RVG85732.1 aminopeptidase P family protein [Sinorhizobium meliloti]RVI37520.1 aminopeptidase P family protein [Sinorhizobium meliloti]RVJ26725.1 aminopeptidase P family protein [Sinorhizobium meliloti]RVP00432.1 aminopeptidase P family protein [Sinorhizobium meliloti]RVP45105.1 aminopeptidase P family protein [Sinorhizobium meliloti]